MFATYRLAAPILLCLTCLGCGTNGNLAEVTGHVTLDGKPLSGAVVQFQPLAKEGSASAGITDSDGYYELMHTFTSEGAMLGEHLVTIRTADAYYDDEDADAPTELIPEQYNVSSTLRRTVESKHNEFNFELQSAPTS